MQAISLFLPPKAVCLHPFRCSTPWRKGTTAGAAEAMKGAFMQRHAGLLSLPVLAALAAPAAAAGTEPAAAFAASVRGTLDIERHHTSNALDRADAWPDWLNALRAGLSVALPHEKGTLRLGLRAEQTAHDVHAIEDDSTLGLSLGGDYAASERLSLGAEAAFTVLSEGDDVAVDGLVLGIRTRTLSGTAAVKAGYRLDEALSLAGEIAASVARPGLTAFEAGLVAPQRLSAQRDTLGAGLRLVHADTARTYAIAAGAEHIKAGVAGEPPYDYRAHRQFARGEAAARWGGLALDAALGAERLALAGTDFDIVRPSLALAASYTFAGGQRLRGAVSAGLDLTGGDDPLGSWLRTVEVEAGAPAGERLTLSAGGALSRRENFLLGYEEDGWSAWAAATVKLAGGLFLKADLGASGRQALLPDAPRIAALDASVSLSLALPAAEGGR